MNGARTDRIGFGKADAPYRPAKLDRTAVLALMEAGVFADRRVELIDGELIEISPANNPHGAAVFRLSGALSVALPANLQGVADGALFLGEGNMVGPDIAILPSDLRIEEAPGNQVVLAIEVSDSSLSHDMGRKARLYSAHGVREYWVIDLENRKLHRHLQPGSEGYGDIQALDWTETIEPSGIPGAALTLAEVLER